MGYISRLNDYSLKHRTLFVGFLAAAGIGTIFNVLSPLVLVGIIDNIIPNFRYELVLPYSLLYITLGALYAVFDILGRYGAAVLSQKVIYNLRRELYDSLMEKDLAFYDQNETGQLLARATTDVTTMREFLFWGYRVIFIGVATLIGTYIMMWTLHPTLTLYMFTLIPFIIIFIYVFAKRVRPVFYEARSQYGILSSVLAENIVGMKVVKSYAAADRELERVKKENQSFLEKRIESLKLLSFYQPLLPAVFGIAIGALIYLSGNSIIIGDLSYGVFVGFLTLVGMLILPARFLSWGVGMYQRASAAGERTFYILDHRDKLLNPENPVQIQELKGEVEFNGVNFSYGGNKYILKNIKLKVEPGQVVALLGGTGSGKTSLVNLIPRFYDVDTDGTIEYQGNLYRVDNKGKVRIHEAEYSVKDNHVEIDGNLYEVNPSGLLQIDGFDVRFFDLDKLRKSVGMVHQDPFLFSATIRENIAFAKPDASLEEIQNAAKAAMIHDFIVTLDEGYDSIIGERGVTLSGGQKQRIAIARALLSDPKILVLDDSVSSVDARTAAKINQALENLMKGRTTFIITHRLSAVRNADLIVMMESGRIIEVGSHSELLAMEGIYHGVYNTLAEMDTLATERESISIEGGHTVE